MKGYLIERYTNMGSAYTTNRLMQEAKKAGVEMSVAGVEDVVLTDGELFCRGKPLEEVDFVINRYKYGTIKDCINRLAGRQYNSQEGLNCYINKANQLAALEGGSFSFPRYILGRQGISCGEIAAHTGLPFVAKGLCSSQGREVYLISGEEEYQEMWRKHSGEELLFQEFIKNSFGRDIRFFLVQGEVAACMERRSKEDFRANFALGGNVQKYEINGRIREIGREIYKRTSLDFIGVDLLFGKEDYLFCELNVTPGIEGIEQATGMNAAGAVISHIMAESTNMRKEG